MRILADSLRGLLGLTAGLAILGSALPGAAQTSREIVSKSVSVGSDAATLALGFDQGAELVIELEDGQVSIDGARVGSFEVDGPLDTAWRNLLSFAVALDERPLATALVDWTPPEELSGEAAETALRIDEALEGAFGESATAMAAPNAQASTPVDASVTLRTLVGLLDRSEALAGLAEALEDVDLDDLRLSVGDDLFIGRDEVVDASLLVLDGDLEVSGHVRGDVVVVDGDLRLVEGGRVDGDVRIAEGAFLDRGGRLEGDLIEIEADDVEMERRIRDELRSEIRSEIRAAARGDQGRRGESVFGRVFGGIGGAVSHFFSVIVVGLIGAAVVHFAGPNLDAVAETARRTPTRALMVGTAGAFLILPAFVLGIVALAISIVGIPALILWIPLFPVAVVLGVGLGFLAVFRNVGIWVARQDAPYLGWVRLTNPVTLIAGGALALAAPSIAAELVSVFPWTGALEMVLRASAIVLTAVVGLLGFGSVLLTRAGRKPEFFDDDLFGGWGARRPRPSSPTGSDDEGLWSEMEASAAAAGRTAAEAMDHAADAVDRAAEAMSAEAGRVASDIDELTKDARAQVDDTAEAIDDALEEAADAVDEALDDAADEVDEMLDDAADEVDDMLDESDDLDGDRRDS